MKHVYANLSYFMKKNDILLWERLFSAFTSEHDEECSVIYVDCDLKSEAFCILNDDVFSKKLLTMTKKTVPFNCCEAGAIYFDIISCKNDFPPRNYLYKDLKKYGLQIVSFFQKNVLDMILNPKNYNENEVILAIDSISAAISYSSYIILESENDVEMLYSICTEMHVNVPKYCVFCECTLLKILCTLSKEYGSVTDINVNQIVVLTARNEDIMKSLPYIEEFMPFIKELVVCCPLQNVQPFKEKYNGRLSLNFITDDELLKDEALPTDHQARNFFLRCKLMYHDILDDIFIMTDDDYRPMKLITMDVFIKDGRYQGYYFYDIREWQGTYNNYTSFDKGAFKTRDFLIKYNYPVLQYSSHQPQIIDKRIFKEMLSVHKGIENNPYDEWSTYFNYGFYVYPDKFKPCKSVSMCWPGHFDSWDISHVPAEYLFENYYDELYKKGQIFDGFSEVYNESIKRENKEKSNIYRKNALKQLKEREVFLNYQKTYSEEKGVYPSIVLSFDEKLRKVRFTVPEYINLPINSWIRVPIAIQTSVYDNIKNTNVFVSYHFINNLGIPVLNSPEIQIENGDKNIMLPVRSPVSLIKNAVMIMRLIFRECTEDNIIVEKKPICIIEKSIKLMLTKIDEV